MRLCQILGVAVDLRHESVRLLPVLLCALFWNLFRFVQLETNRSGVVLLEELHELASTDHAVFA